MTTDEYRAALTALGLSQREFASFAGVNERTSHRWASDQQDIPGWVPVMLRLMRQAAFSAEVWRQQRKDSKAAPPIGASKGAATKLPDTVPSAEAV